ncbi:MAG: DUF1109 domain-containing protein [Burkholderiales bacterium]|nr:MAG: DUF1109 domain-containing protein [Burkholderiales bacterium]TAG79784.1 MAG: DUF1109 domain-containing protein [Betaproteobacteria bacterium]
MKTDQLIEMLAKHDVPVNKTRIALQVSLAVALGFIGSFVLLLVVFDMNPDLGMLFNNMWFWVRFLFIVSVGAISAAVLARLGRPAEASRVSVWLIVVPFALLALVAASMLVMAPREERADMLLGISWDVCARNISLLALPLFVSAIWIAKQFAPVRLRVTGAIAGLFAGAGAALIYSLHCPEIEPAFLVVWYSLGMMIPAVVGAVLAGKLLKW